MPSSPACAPRRNFASASPTEGTWRFLADLLLRLTVRQYVLEIKGAEERGYGGFGPKFAEQANRVGHQLGLKPVIGRRRGTDTTSPLAHGWPHCVRPAGYYHYSAS